MSNHLTYHKKCFNAYDDKDKLKDVDMELKYKDFTKESVKYEL